MNDHLPRPIKLADYLYQGPPIHIPDPRPSIMAQSVDGDTALRYPGFGWRACVPHGSLAEYKIYIHYGAPFV